MRRGVAAAAALCCALMAGCLGPVQADDYMYVVGVGFDRGESYKYELSFLVQKEVGGEGQSSTGGAEVLCAEGDSIFDAITTIHAGGPFQLNFSRVNTLMFSRELAEEGDIEQLADIAFNALKLRQSVKLMVSLCPAKDFMEGLSSADIPNATKMLFSLLENYNVGGTIQVTNYSLMMESIRDQRMDNVMALGGVDKSAAQQASQQEGQDGQGGGGVGNGGGGNEGGGNSGGKQGENQGQGQEQAEYTTAGVKRSGGMEAYVSGVALFDGWEMTGVIDGHDVKFLLLGKGDFDTGSITVPYGGDRAVIYLKNAKTPRVELTLGQRPRAVVELELVCGILQYMGDYGVDEWEQGLKEAAESYMEEEVSRVFGICRDLNSDAMGFGRYASMKFDNAVDWEMYDWNAAYPRMEAEFRVYLELADENITTRLE